MKFTMRTISLTVAGLLLIMFTFAGFAAAAKNRANPPVLSEPQWDSPETRSLAERACFDCHSNETKWPIYSALPIIGRLIEDHVIQGRDHLNFSQWNRPQEEAGEAVEKVFEPMHYAEDDVIPQPPYSLFHPKARLTSQEREQLAAGLRATLASEGEANPIRIVQSSPQDLSPSETPAANDDD